MDKFDEILNDLDEEQRILLLLSTVELQTFSNHIREVTKDERVMMATINITEECLKQFGNSNSVIEYNKKAYPNTYSNFTNGDAINNYLNDLKFAQSKLRKFIERSVEEGDI